MLRHPLISSQQSWKGRKEPLHGPLFKLAISRRRHPPILWTYQLFMFASHHGYTYVHSLKLHSATRSCGLSFLGCIVESKQNLVCVCVCNFSYLNMDFFYSRASIIVIYIADFVILLLSDGFRKHIIFTERCRMA